MTLADTSVWVNHFRRRNEQLEEMLSGHEVLMHPFVIGEIACGDLPHRRETLSDLQLLPQVLLAGDDEVLALVEEHRLYGKGIGWVDVHLLASALLSHCRLWSVDRPLRDAAESLGIIYP